MSSFLEPPKTITRDFKLASVTLAGSHFLQNSENLPTMSESGSNLSVLGRQKERIPSLRTCLLPLFYRNDCVNRRIPDQAELRQGVSNGKKVELYIWDGMGGHTASNVSPALVVGLGEVGGAL